MNNPVLNPALYRRLRRLGNVIIANQGVAQVRKIRKDIVTGRKKVDIITPGEYYRVCCPFCNDTDHKCYINHMYGVQDEYGNPEIFLIHCFKAGCPLNSKLEGIYHKAKEYFIGRTLPIPQKAIVKSSNASSTIKPCKIPEGTVGFDSLEPKHHAFKYLANRGFDPVELTKLYGIGWCSNRNDVMCYNRIIIPIYQKGKLVSWQARVTYDKEKHKTPKYYFAKNSKKSNYLYNLDLARGFKTGIIVEGVTDVWRVGACAVATLGAHISDKQKVLFENAFMDYSGVLLYDGDVADKDEVETNDKLHRIIDTFSNKFKGGFCWVKLPSNTDPAMLSTKKLRKYVSQEAEKQGVTVDWGLR